MKISKIIWLLLLIDAFLTKQISIPNKVLVTINVMIKLRESIEKIFNPA